ncbi:hypothetical protein V5738_03880 [Salinisphaera sp. SPP-AMP-43]|uniref:hypothetical protein n=1 Tax=Salinisphaera sp. SPP-AMP-43 TaxID=3121288 RepID=UPI003C6E3105
MLKKTAIAVGLTMVAGTGMAASGGLSSDGPTAQAAATDTGSAKALFQRLDTNNDGVLSQSEAQANDQVAELYSSMNNSTSIQSDPQANPTDINANGVTLNQFEAGMTAASGGAAGPSVEGGQVYTIMKDGSHRMSSQAAQKAHNGMMHGQQRMQQASQAMQNTSSQMRQNAQNKMSSMQHSAGHDMSQAQSNMQHRRNQMQDQLRDEARGTPQSANDRMNADAQTLPSADNDNTQY